MVRALLGTLKNSLLTAFDRARTKVTELNTQYKYSRSSLGKSASANTSYPELALKAALSPPKYAVFRRHYLYTPILEHVSVEDASSYLQIIKCQHGLSEDEILNAIAPLQSIGRPYRLNVPGLELPVSTTSIRYLKVALELKQKLIGIQNPKIVEIGCGYGGQAVVLDRVIKIHSYTFIDLWQVNMLIQRFIEDAEINCQYQIETLGSISKGFESWDLAVSNYAFSELPRALQERYISNILSRSNRGYMIMNSGVDGCFAGIKNLSKSELCRIFPGSQIKPEMPQTFHGNYLLEW